MRNERHPEGGGEGVSISGRVAWCMSLAFSPRKFSWNFGKSQNIED